ncbi:hypothetical protein SLI_1834 [Streptomyces lividans 1326]|uniref:Uncharacterized protein n=1 Tax=Streptomyces lividans 1326 TaxID=1200984 RepID=A0A7U9DM77_STRLI|nr:hypothetical protein SLI_1834 [Streptomyces lividans 1326]
MRQYAHRLDLFGEPLGARGGVVGPEEEFRGAGDAVGGVRTQARSPRR